MSGDRPLRPGLRQNVQGPGLVQASTWLQGERAVRTLSWFFPDAGGQRGQRVLLSAQGQVQSGAVELPLEAVKARPWVVVRLQVHGWDVADFTIKSVKIITKIITYSFNKQQQQD